MKKINNEGGKMMGDLKILKDEKGSYINLEGVKQLKKIIVLETLDMVPPVIEGKFSNEIEELNCMMFDSKPDSMYVMTTKSPCANWHIYETQNSFYFKDWVLISTFGSTEFFGDMFSKF